MGGVMTVGQCVFVMGVPGSGKDLQGDKLYAEMGDYFRAVISMSGTIESALEGEGILGYTKDDKKAGILLDDTQCCALIQERLGTYPDECNLVVTGFPRTQVQAEFVVDYCMKRRWRIVFLLLTVSEDVAMERVKFRREKDLGETGKMRADDAESVARVRYTKQLKHLMGMEPHLRRFPGFVFRVDTHAEPNKVFGIIRDLLLVTA